jgi:hypothetical protein
MKNIAKMKRNPQIAQNKRKVEQKHGHCELNIAKANFDPLLSMDGGFLI